MSLWYVENGGYIAKLKDPTLNMLARQGSCRLTPLEKKARFHIESWNEQGDICRVSFFAPESLQANGGYLPDRTFNLSPAIPPAVWREVFDVTNMYEENNAQYIEDERIRQVVKRFEKAAVYHGIMKGHVANGLIDADPTLYESGKALREARKDVYYELVV